MSRRSVLLLRLSAGDQHYALAGRRVREVIGRLTLQAVPGAPKPLIGAFNYRGSMTPVLDLCEIVLGRPCGARVSSRIVLFDGWAFGKQRVVGLLAERVTEACHVELEGTGQDGVMPGTTILVREGTMLTLLDVDELASRVLPAPSSDLARAVSHGASPHH